MAAKPKEPKVQHEKLDQGIPKYITRRQACEFWGINDRTLRDMIALNIVILGPNVRMIDTQQSTRNYLSNLREKAAGRATSGGRTLADARAEESATATEINKMKLAQMRGQSIPIDQLIPSWTAFAASIKAKFMGLPAKMRATIPHLTAHDAVTIRKLVRDELRDLAEEVEATVIGADPKDLNVANERS